MAGPWQPRRWYLEEGVLRALAAISRATVKALDHLFDEIPEILELPERAMMELETMVERALFKALKPPQGPHQLPRHTDRYSTVRPGSGCGVRKHPHPSFYSTRPQEPSCVPEFSPSNSRIPSLYKNPESPGTSPQLQILPFHKRKYNQSNVTFPHIWG